jgi:hypothetical protein
LIISYILNIIDKAAEFQINYLDFISTHEVKFENKMSFSNSITAIFRIRFFKNKSVLYLILLFAMYVSSLSAAEYPALPQVFINTEFILPIGGQLFKVNSSASFQSALNNANLGDIIELKSDVTFTGPFTLPEKTSGSGWIYIMSSAYASLPTPCTRVTPAHAQYMPKIVNIANNGGVVNTVPNAHHYRFVGIEFKPVTGNFMYNVIVIGSNETAADRLPNNLIFDRCYIHGDPVAGSRRGVLMNGAFISVIDSYVSDCKEDGADSQALAAYSTTGPIKIVNNYLEGAGENVIFGGADPTIQDAVPSDIEIRSNHFFKPLSWMDEEWDIKNLLEFKNAQRVLVEGNHFENCWPNAQSGFALLLTPRNQNNTAPWSAVRDIWIRFNTFDNIAQGVNISGYDAPNTSQRTSRILIQNNVWNVTNLGTGGDGRMFQVLNGPTDVIFDHNTGFCTNAYMVSDGSPKTDSFVFQNNLVTYATYGFIGSGTGNANTTLAMYFNPNWVVTHNAIIGGSSTNYPGGNYFPANIAAVKFVDYAAGDYRLTDLSPYKNLGTDGKDLGADIDSIAIVSIYNCNVQTGSENLHPYQNDCIVFPNPVDRYLECCVDSWKNTDWHVNIFDYVGHKILYGKLYPDSKIIDVSSLPNGIYILQLQEGGNKCVQKFLVQH